MVAKTFEVFKLKTSVLRNGKPIGFGQNVTFVCDRGMAFEDDFFRESVEYTCQVSVFSFTSYHAVYVDLKISLGRMG